jgi:hypothetical protein
MTKQKTTNSAVKKTTKPTTVKPDEKPKTNAVQKKESEAIAQTGLGFSISQNHGGAGLEGADSETLAIPFLRAIQKGSPEVEEGNSAYIEDARPGMLLNTVSRELYSGKEGVLFLPCAFQRRFLRFAPRGEGGFKGSFLPDAVMAMIESGQVNRDDGYLEMEGDKLYDTRSHYGLMFNPNTEVWESVLLTLRSTQVKKSRRLMSLLMNARVEINGKKICPPTWVNIIRLTTALESNDKGSWHGINPDAAGFIESQEVYDQGAELYKSILADEVKVDYSQVDLADGAATSDDEGKF